MTLNLENYRSSREYREILRILQKSSSLQENFLWQTNAIGRNVVPIHHFEIDFVSREVVIYFNSKHCLIQPELTLYVKLDYRTSVFKVEDYRQGSGTLHFSFPKEIKTQELRLNPRHSFDPSQEKRVTLKASMKGKIEGLGEIQVRTIDISYFGLGLMISDQNRSFMKNNRILWITHLHDSALDYPILAEVVYVSPELDVRYQNRRSKDLKVGLKLSGVFSEENFHQFIQ